MNRTTPSAALRPAGPAPASTTAPRRRPSVRPAGALALAAVLAACASPGEGEGPPPGGLDILFVGNSLTATNDLPGTVARLARETGRPVTVQAVARPGWSLEEHHAAGLEDRIRRLRPRTVVFQQGPSSLPESRAHLVEWTRRLAPVVEEVGGRVALLMVWPEASREHVSSAVEASYVEAARAVGGVLVPAGAVWRRARELDPALPLHGPDGFHPSRLGTLVTAHAVLVALLGVPADALPADGLPARHLEVVGEAFRDTFPEG